MFGNFLAEKHNRWLATLALAGLVAALGSYTYFTLKQASEWNAGIPSINVTGEGEVTAMPDIAQFSFSVVATAPTADVAQDMVAATTTAIIEYLKSEGVEEKDIKTDGYNMYPHYTYATTPCPFGSYCPPTEPKEDGMEVSQMITVKVRDTAKAGDLVGGTGDRGAKNISGVTFTIDDESALKDQAREAAIADARAKAEALAEQLGVELGDLVGYYEEQPYQPYGYGGTMMDMAMSAREEMAPNLPMGEGTMTSRVSLMYEINN